VDGWVYNARMVNVDASNPPFAKYRLFRPGFCYYLRNYPDYLYLFFLSSLRILNPALELLFAESRYKASPSFKFNKLQSLPCGCPTAAYKDSEKYLSKYEYTHIFFFRTCMNNRKERMYNLTQWAKSPKKQSVRVYFWQHGTVF